MPQTQEKDTARAQKSYKVQFGTQKMQLGAEMPSFFAPCGTKIAAKETGKRKKKQKSPE